MRFKLFFGVSIFNIFIVVLVVIFGLLKEYNFLAEPTMVFSKFIILGLALAALGVWSLLGCFVNCPHCGRQALLFNMDQERVRIAKPKVPFLLRPFSFLIDDEYFAGYCHCQSCNERIEFK